MVPLKPQNVTTRCQPPGALRKSPTKVHAGGQIQTHAERNVCHLPGLRSICVVDDVGYTAENLSKLLISTMCETEVAGVTLIPRSARSSDPFFFQPGHITNGLSEFFIYDLARPIYLVLYIAKLLACSLADDSGVCPISWNDTPRILVTFFRGSIPEMRAS